MITTAHFKEFLSSELLYSPLTIRAYMDDLAAWAKYVGDTPLEECSANDARAYVMTMIERGDSPRSINRRICSLRKYYNYLVRCNAIEKNPIAKIHTLKAPKRLPNFVDEPKMNQITQEMVDQSLNPDNYLDARNATMIFILYMSGMRRAELVSLTTSSIDIAQQYIRVVGKGNKERLVPFGDEFKGVVERYLQQREMFCCNCEQKSLFLNKKQEPITQYELYSVVRQTLEMAGVDARCSPHTLRHTFATHLLSHGVSIPSIQQLLGHSSIASTQIYTHNTIESLTKSYSNAHPRAKIK